jgi:hypothetical protein
MPLVLSAMARVRLTLAIIHHYMIGGMKWLMN